MVQTSGGQQALLIFCSFSERVCSRTKGSHSTNKIHLAYWLRVDRLKIKKELIDLTSLTENLRSLGLYLFPFSEAAWQWWGACTPELLLVYLNPGRGGGYDDWVIQTIHTLLNVVFIMDNYTYIFTDFLQSQLAKKGGNSETILFEELLSDSLWSSALWVPWGWHSPPFKTQDFSVRTCSSTGPSKSLWDALE